MRLMQPALPFMQYMYSRFTKGMVFSRLQSATVAAVLLSVMLPSVSWAQESVSVMPEKPAAAANQSDEFIVDAVNINTADAETLALALDGIGLTRALDIIAYREEYGDFKNVEQIQQVRGIGIATFARNRAKMRVSDVE